MRQQLGLIVFKVVAAPLNGVKPTVVLVHGAWADTSSWDGEVSALTKQGYDARAIAHPTELENLTTDSEYVANFLKSMSGAIVLVGHSYGGSVITNAAEGNPNVKALVYVDAAAPRCRRDQRLAERIGFDSQAEAGKRTVRQGSVPGRPAGNDRSVPEEGRLPPQLRQLAADEATRPGRHRVAPTMRSGAAQSIWPPVGGDNQATTHSQRPPKPRRGRRFRRGTSSAAATRYHAHLREADGRAGTLPRDGLRRRLASDADRHTRRR